MAPSPPFARTDPRYAQMLHAIFAQAVAAHQAGQLDAAAELYRQILTFEKRQFDAMHMLAVVTGQKGDLAEGVRLLTKAIKENPDSADAHLNLGGMQGKLGDHASAIRSLRKSITLQPNNPLAHGNLSAALREAGAFAEALAAAERATALNGASAANWINRGNVLLDLARHDDARQCYERALSLSRSDTKAWLGLANARFQLQDYSGALAAYDEVLKAGPDTPYAAGLRLMCKAHLCDWRDWESERSGVIAAMREKRRVVLPLSAIGIATTPADQLLCAQIHAADKFGGTAPQRPSVKRGAERIRIAYLSGDFRTHPVGYLTAGLFEQHDRVQFELIALSNGADDGSAIRQRLVGAFDHFIDIGTTPDAEIAELIRKRGIDILVDLAGYTQGSRPGILALRPAPVQVAYLGYPSTMGAAFVDYILADATTIPDSDHAFYAEKVVTLPGSYQVNDNARERAREGVTRADAGLPNDGFVFCCFNNAFKITPPAFEAWMRIMTRVPGSLLWLSARNETAQDNLRREAQARGIAAERLIFTTQVETDLHMARYRLAGLFLDTLDYNAHTTASDALWNGLPVLTLPGATFASRVAASLVKAAGTPETIVTSLAEYEELAVALAQDEAGLAALKQRLVEGRSSCALFDTQRFARHIETAYRLMLERARKGERPAPLAIAG